MKKMNSKGFMLTETLIVATLLVTVLLVVYVQFKSINRKISRSFEYNTVASLYNLYNVKLYIEQEKFTAMVSRLYLDDYIDITPCSSIYFNNPEYCDSVIRNAGIKKLIITKENLYSLIDKKPFYEELNNFIETIDYSKSDGYRLIAQFNNNTFASIRVLNSSKFDSIIANSCILSIPKTFKINYLKEDGSLLKEPLIESAGCNSSIIVSRYEDNRDSCYYVSRYSNNILNINEDESLNNATIYYDKYDANITIHYKDLSNNTISPDFLLNGKCGNKYYPEKYKKLISGYNYSNASIDNVLLSNTNIEVTLYYEEGSGDNE